jgi:hypothetical protein
LTGFSAAHRVSLQRSLWVVRVVIVFATGFRTLFRKRREEKMTFKRLLMPMIILGIVLSMGSMAFAQSTVTCGMTNAAGASVGPIAALAGGVAVAGPGNTKVDISGAVVAPAPPIAGFPALQGPSAHAASTGHVEVTSAGATRVPPSAGGGALRIFCYNPGPTVNPGVIVLTVSFAVPITNTTAFPPSGKIVTTNGTWIAPGTGGGAATVPGTGATGAGGNGGFATGGANQNVGIASMTNGPTGSIVIGIGTPASPAGTPTTGVSFIAGSVVTFDLDGILLGVNGKSGEIDATLTEISGAVNLAGQTVAAITNVTGPIQDPSVLTSPVPSLVTSQNTVGGVAPSAGPAVLNSNGTALKGNFTVRIQENFPEMWQSSTQYNGGGVFPTSPASNTQVNLIFKNVPAGLNISNCVASLTDQTGTTNTTSGQPTISANSVTAASNILTVSFVNNMDLTNTDVLWVTCASVSQGGATLPLPSTSVTVQAEMGPLGAALSSLNAALTGLATGLIPRYQDTPQPATGVTVIVFPPSQTALLVTYAVVVPGFNTGIAISNTTTDPFGSSGGGATPTDGTITFTLFKNDGTSKSFTTATVKSGTTYAANLSDILSSAGFGTTFSGYIFAQANFSFAHGAATIYDTATGHAALSTPVLVVESGGQNITSANARNSPEFLSQ